jgi:hypothetical protein
MREIWGGFEETLRSGVSALEVAAQGATALLEEAGADTASRLGEQETDSEGKTHDFQHRTASQRHEEMAEGTRRAIDRARERLENELVPTLRDALSALHDEGLPALAASLEQATEELGVGLGLVGSLAVFAPPMAWAHGVVGTIGDLLDAMNLGL